MKPKKIEIAGMTCNHCVMHVKKELAAVAGVQVGDVQIGNATVTVDEKSVTDDALTRAVQKAGYEVKSIQ